MGARSVIQKKKGSRTLKLILTLILWSSVLMVYSQDVSLMTYNIRYDNPGDQKNRWDNRKEFLINQLKFYEPDILGIQEGLIHQVEYIDSSLKNYAYIGVGRDNGDDKGEFSAIYYHRSKFHLIKNSTFWLSETPQKISVGWDAALERICTYGLFKEKESGKKLWVFNTHFDHMGKTARKESAHLIIKKIKELTKKEEQVVLMGDFNLEPGSEGINAILSVLKDAKAVSTKVSYGPEGTYNGFNYEKYAERRIDYIFTDPSIQVKKYGTLNETKNNRYPSDHFPVFVLIDLKTK